LVSAVQRQSNPLYSITPANLAKIGGQVRGHA
jgi:hypothetical protein